MSILNTAIRRDASRMIAAFAISMAYAGSVSATPVAVASASNTIILLTVEGDFIERGPQVSASFVDVQINPWVPRNRPIHEQDIGPRLEGSNSPQAFTQPYITEVGRVPEDVFSFVRNGFINGARADAMVTTVTAQNVAEASVEDFSYAAATSTYVETRGIQMNTSGSLTLSFLDIFSYSVGSARMFSSAGAFVTNEFRIAEAIDVLGLPVGQDFRLGLPKSVLKFSDEAPVLYKGCSGPFYLNCSQTGVETLKWVTPQLDAGGTYLIQFYSTATTFAVADVAVSDVPEPETYALLMGGLVYLALVTRGRRRNK